MQVFYRAKTIPRLSSVLNTLLFSTAVITLLSTLGCGGNGSTSSSPLAQTPAPAPADAGTASSQSSSGSTPSSGSSSSSSTPSSSSTVPSTALVNAAVQSLPGWDWCTAKLNGKPCASGLGNATSTLT